MRRKFLTTAAAIFLLSFSVCFFVESAPIEDNLWNYETFKVGYVRNTGFMSENRPRHKTGYGYDYMEFLSHYAHCKFNYIEFNSWDALVTAFANNEIDLMPGMPGDYHKVPNAVRTDHVVGRFPMELVLSGGIIKSHLKIGTTPASYPAPSFPQIAQDENFTYEEISFPTFAQMLAAYRSNEIDGYIDAMLSNNNSSNIVALFDRQSYRLLVHADNPELFNRINNAMDKMLLVQPSIRDKLNQKYLRNDGFPLTLTADEKKYLADRKKLKAAIFIYCQPFTYRDENGKLVGLFPDLLNRIAEDLILCR